SWAKLETPSELRESGGTSVGGAQTAKGSKQDCNTFTGHTVSISDPVAMTVMQWTDETDAIPDSKIVMKTALRPGPVGARPPVLDACQREKGAFISERQASSTGGLAPTGPGRSEIGRAHV